MHDVVAELTEDARALADKVDADSLESDTPIADPLVKSVSRRLSALAGQLRAISELAPAAGEGGGLRSRRPHRPTVRPLAQLREALAQIRADASLASPAGRHAVRLAVVVTPTELISRELPCNAATGW